MGFQREQQTTGNQSAGQVATPVIGVVAGVVSALVTAAFVATVVVTFGLVLMGLATAAAAQVDAEHLITADGVGNAVVGSTPAQMHTQLGPDFDLVDIGAFLVDIEGLEAQVAGTPQFFAGHVVGEGPGLDLLVVTNSDYQTAAGVGPGTTIADAEAIYGDATLSFNVNDESREFVRFENGPEGRILFRVDNEAGMAGIYADTNVEFAETTEYAEGATIASVWVSCVDNCPVTRLPDTGAGDATAILALAGVTMLAAGVIVKSGLGADLKI